MIDYNNVEYKKMNFTFDCSIKNQVIISYVINENKCEIIKCYSNIFTTFVLDNLKRLDINIEEKSNIDLHVVIYENEMLALVNESKPKVESIYLLNSTKYNFYNIVEILDYLKLRNVTNSQKSEKEKIFKI